MDMMLQSSRQIIMNKARLNISQYQNNNKIAIIFTLFNMWYPCQAILPQITLQPFIHTNVLVKLEISKATFPQENPC